MSQDPFDLEGKTDGALYKWTAQWKQSTAKYIAGQQEIERRNDKPGATRSWVAIGIAGGALLVSLIALVVSLLK